MVQRFQYASRIDTHDFLNSRPSYDAIKPRPDTQDRVTQFIYNEKGQLSHEISANGFITAYSYSSLGHLCEKRLYSQAMSNYTPGILLKASDLNLTEDANHDRLYQYYYDTAGTGHGVSL